MQLQAGEPYPDLNKNAEVLRKRFNLKLSQEEIQISHSYNFASRNQRSNAHSHETY